jgi:hypothetical protein
MMFKNNPFSAIQDICCTIKVDASIVLLAKLAMKRLVYKTAKAPLKREILDTLFSRSKNPPLFVFF